MPATGDGISTEALSVITSARPWSSTIDVAGRDVPDDELDLGDAFAEVGDSDHVHAHQCQASMTRFSAAATRSGPGKYAHSSACGYGVSQPVTRSIGASR